MLGDPVAVDLVAEGERTLVQPLQFPLSGVAKGGVAKVVTEADGEGQVFHQIPSRSVQALADRLGDGRHMEDVLNPSANMVVLRGEEDLCLMLEPAEGERVDDRRLIAEVGPPNVLFPRLAPSLIDRFAERVLHLSPPLTNVFSRNHLLPFDPSLGGIEVALIELHPREAPPQGESRHARTPYPHEGVEDKVAGIRRNLHKVTQNLQGLLGRMKRLFNPLLPHTERALDEVVHPLLTEKVPLVPPVPTANHEFTAVEETRPPHLRDRIDLVPDQELKGIEERIQEPVPLPQEVVGCEEEEVSRWVQDPPEGFDPLPGAERAFIPGSQIVVDLLAPSEPDVPGRIGAEVIGGIGEEKVHASIRDLRQKLQAVPVLEGIGSLHGFLLYPTGRGTSIVNKDPPLHPQKIHRVHEKTSNQKTP